MAHNEANIRKDAMQTDSTADYKMDLLVNAGAALGCGTY